ncbi:MAG: hypothetical protein PHF37_07445 [Phycisphaerae bacterium]|nr:hypothetical protein [Phycisphaerae bacterium]
MAVKNQRNLRNLRFKPAVSLISNFLLLISETWQFLRSLPRAKSRGLNHHWQILRREIGSKSKKIKKISQSPYLFFNNYLQQISAFSASSAVNDFGKNRAGCGDSRRATFLPTLSFPRSLS